MSTPGLFHRSTRAIALTGEGGLLLERCRRIFAEVNAATHELSASREAPRGRLRLSLPLAGMLLMPILSNFMKAYPDIRLDLDFTDRVVDVIEEGFDAVVRTGEVVVSRLGHPKARRIRPCHRRISRLSAAPGGS